MMFIALRFILFLTFFSSAYNTKLPSTLKTCNRKQPDFKECVLKAAQDGVDQIGVLVEKFRLPSVDPFLVQSATIGAGKGTVAVTQNFKDCKIFGLPHVKFDVFEFDFEKKTLHISGVFPEVKKQCHYDIEGKVLLLEMKGSGQSTIILKNVKFNALMKYEENKKNDKTFIKIISDELQIDPGLISFNFENLFNGDKKLGDNMNKVLNDNWREVFEDVKDGYIEFINQVILNEINQFFAKVSFEELFDQ